MGASPFVVRHHGHVRLSALCYGGFSFTPFADRMLRERVDLVVPDAKFLRHIEQIAPKTPTAIYANLSNAYLGGLLEDWVEYADDHGHDREDLFFHAATAGTWSGAGGSTQPVTWFHTVLQGGTKHADRTSDARSPSTPWTLPTTVGSYCAVGYLERFREIHVAQTVAAGNGWACAIEYPTAVGPGKAPTAWSPLPILSDRTSGFTAKGGSIVFDPPHDWRPCKIGGSALHHFVRVRCIHGGRPPTVDTLLGRDWAGAGGGTSGKVQAFDAAADADRDGYLDDAEYARRAAGKDARFLYESRMFTTYGQMRFVVRPTKESVRAWALHNCRNYLAASRSRRACSSTTAAGLRDSAMPSRSRAPLRSPRSTPPCWPASRRRSRRSS